MTWNVELSDEVADWYTAPADKPSAQADRAMTRLQEQGPALRGPHSRALGGGSLELRFTCGDHTQRITYYFDRDRNAISLTTFFKQRNNERREVDRARRAMRVSKGDD